MHLHGCIYTRTGQTNRLLRRPCWLKIGLRRSVWTRMDRFFRQRCVLFATKCDFCSARFPNKAKSREQQNTSVFPKAASPINTKVLGNRVETIACKTQSATYCFGNNPGWRQLRMHEMSLFDHGRWSFLVHEILHTFLAFQHLCSRFYQLSANLFQGQSYSLRQTTRETSRSYKNAP